MFRDFLTPLLTRTDPRIVECEAIIHAGIVRRQRDDERVIDQPTTAFVEFLQAASEVGSNAVWPELGPSKLPMSEASFRNFMSFLKEKRSDLEKADGLLRAFNRVAAANSDDSEFGNWLEYLRIYTSLVRDSNGSNAAKFLLPWIFGVTGGVAGAALEGTAKKGTELGIGHYAEVSLPRRKFLLGLVGAGAGSAVGAAGSGLVAMGAHIIPILR
jgi:hypothetical protein